MLRHKTSVLPRKYLFDCPGHVCTSQEGEHHGHDGEDRPPAYDWIHSALFGRRLGTRTMMHHEGLNEDVASSRLERATVI